MAEFMLPGVESSGAVTQSCSEALSTPWAGAGAEARQRSQGAIRARRPEQPGKALK